MERNIDGSSGFWENYSLKRRHATMFVLFYYESLALLFTTQYLRCVNRLSDVYHMTTIIINVTKGTQ